MDKTDTARYRGPPSRNPTPKDSGSSFKSLKSRKSVASKVWAPSSRFLDRPLSVAERLGGRVKKDEDEQAKESINDALGEEQEEDRKKKAMKKKKKDECKKFCCDRANKTCMGKSGSTWTLIVLLIIFFWLFLILLMYAFFSIFLATIGGLPDRNSTKLADKKPPLVDLDVVLKNAKKGWAGGTIEWPFKLGSQLTFPGVSPLTDSVWVDSKDPEKRKLFEKYRKNPILIFSRGEDGKPTEEWQRERSDAYRDYFNMHYTTPAHDIPICDELDGFRKLDGSNGPCRWPNHHKTTAASFTTYSCDQNDLKKCFPYLYFTVNRVWGWIPQKIGTELRGNIYCELDLNNVKNEGLKKEDFSGAGELNCTGELDDFCGIVLARFPYYGQLDMESPVIRYKITNMPLRPEEFVIHCRLDYSGYEKQMKDLRWPFNFRPWTNIRISAGDKSCQPHPLVISSLSLIALLLAGMTGV